MDNAIILQYVLLAIIVIFACYSLFRIIRKNFTPGRFKKSKPGCDRDCCS